MSTQLGLYTTLFFIDRNDSPCHIFIVFVFGQFGYYFYNFEINAKTSIVIICLVLIFFFSLVFNEIIELRFCKIAHNTKKNITQRAENEVGNTLDVNNEIKRSNTIIELNDYSFEYGNE